MLRLLSKFVLLILAILQCCGRFSEGKAATIEITNTPAYGSFDNLGGRVSGITPAQYRVAVFIFVPGAGWWSKPFCNPQLTPIDSNTSWNADITTGGNDALATKITALLVSSNYNEPCVQGAAVLPANVVSQGIAQATVERVDPSLRWIQFSGYEWWVKKSTGLAGPGPNYFSDSGSNVWVDAQGRLHLRITHRTNQWQCAEVVSRRTFGYGSYRFELASNVNDLNVNAVLGLFTWSDDPAYAHREIDVECSRWGNAADPNNSQFVVQPWDTPGHLVRYTVPATQTNSTHLFVWETNRVTFKSLRGPYVSNPVPGDVITNWIYGLSVPQSGDENVRFNLWLFNGAAPAGNSEVEFVIKSFEFIPLGPAQPAVLTNVRPGPGSQILFTVQGQADWRYQLQTSTNLLDWAELQTVLATNHSFEVVATNTLSAGAQFFRTITRP